MAETADRHFTGATAGRFALGALLGLAVWAYMWPIYRDTQLPLINLLLQVEHLPVHVQRQGHVILMALHEAEGLGRLLRLAGHEASAWPSLAAVVLFSATPGYGRRWRVRWLLLSMPLFWVLDLLVLYAGTQLALAGYLEALPELTHPAGLTVDSWLLTHASPAAIGSIIGWTSVWGFPLLLLALWFVAVSPSLFTETASSAASYARGVTP